MLFSCHRWYWTCIRNNLSHESLSLTASVSCGAICQPFSDTSVPQTPREYFARLPISILSCLWMTRSEGVTWPSFQRHSRRWETQAGLTRVPLTGPRGNVKVRHISCLLSNQPPCQTSPCWSSEKPLPCNHATHRTLHSAERACVLCRCPRRRASCSCSRAASAHKKILTYKKTKSNACFWERNYPAVKTSLKWNSSQT